MHGLNELMRLNAIATAHCEDERRAVEQLSNAALADITRRGLDPRTRDAITSIEKGVPLSEIARSER